MNTNTPRLNRIPVTLMLLATALASAQIVAPSANRSDAPPSPDCDPAWIPTFVGSAALDGTVRALVNFDDGDGSIFVAGGDFTDSGGVSNLNRIASWDGVRWTPLGEGLNNTVWALAVFDGSLYAGGDFTASGPAGGIEHIARWNGTAWEPVGGGVNNPVRAFLVHDDGSGEALYVGGNFSDAGGIPDADRIARWSGTAWSALSSGVNDRVNVLEVYDEGSGPALYAGGRFSRAGGVSVNRVARWNGTLWSALDTGVTGGSSPWVRTITVFDDGSGQALYVGGGFGSAGGVAGTQRIARWQGGAWSALGQGLSRGTTPSVDALEVFDDGTGPALYAGGFFDSAGSLATENIARWDGSQWRSLGTGTNRDVLALLATHTDAGPALVVGGAFSLAGSASAGRAALWQGCAAAACPPDLDGDGLLTIFDFLAFQNLFDARDPLADFDGDGSFTIFDFLAFQNAFDAGCM